MRSGSFWRQLLSPGESGDLAELRRSTILEIATMIFAAVWLMLVASYGTPQQMIVPFVLLASALGSYALRRISFRLALGWMVVTLIAAISFQKCLYPDTAAEYAFPLVVVISSLLVSGLNIFLVAAACAAALVLVAGWLGPDRDIVAWMNDRLVLEPLLLTFLTACAAWVGSRQIHLALDWMGTSYTRANQLLDQLRDERASLARTLKMLEDAYVRIEKMNYALIEARTAADNARQLKAEFAANISHELRTPLNLVIGFSETMANAPETYSGVQWSPALRGDIEQIYQSSRHLASLIDDILDLSALEARRLGLDLEEGSIEQVIAEAVTLMQDLFHAKGLYLDVHAEKDLPHVRMDVTRIRQVLINLLTNAVRFTTSGGVTIRTRAVDGEIEVAVEDTGIGIAPYDVSKVFEEFGQVDGSMTRKHEGTGLGVPLSKRLVESHGGRMWLTSQRGKGTVFYFTLPVLTSLGHIGAISTAYRIPPRASRRALIAYEPDPLLLRTIRRQLGGYDVIEISDWSDLPALQEQCQPVALVVVVREPGALQVDVPGDLPVIRIALIGNLRAAQALGVQNYLIKPVLREQLLQAIGALGQPVRHVLIVDDDPEMVDLLARMLQSAGETYRPIKTLGADEALARLQGERVDLVLLDLSMPGADGMTLLQQMRRDTALANIPVIIVSAQNPEVTTGSGLLIQMERHSNASATETLTLLQALVETLPRRDLSGRDLTPAPAPG